MSFFSIAGASRPSISAFFSIPRSKAVASMRRILLASTTTRIRTETHKHARRCPLGLTNEKG